VIPGVSALRPSQWALLDALCRAQSAASGHFLAVGTFGGTFIRHDGLPEPLKDFAFSDLNELQTQGMIRLTTKSGSSTRFEITNDDWKYWEAHQETRVERIEAEVRRLLDPAPSGGRTRQRSLAGRRPGIPSESKSGQPALDEDEPLHSCDSQGTGFVSHLVTGGSTASDRKSCGVDARGLRLP